MKKLIALTFALQLLIASTLFATNWYVDNTATGSNNGTSWTNAWTTIGAISGPTTGDTVYISGGTSSKTYAEQIVAATAGVSYKPGALESSPNANHSGQVILAYVGNEAVYINANNVTIDGWIDGLRKFKFTTSSVGVRSANSKTGAVVRGIEATATGDLAYFNGSTGEISYCYAHELLSTADHGIAILALPTGFGQVTVHHNVLTLTYKSTDPGYGPDFIQVTNGVDFYDNTLTAVSGTYTGSQHMDGVQGGSYLRIYNNTFVNLPQYSVYNAHDLGAATYVYVHDNLFFGVNSAWAGGNNNNSYILLENNTITDCISRGFEFSSTSGTDALTNAIIRNNIFVNCKQPIYLENGNYTCGSDVIVDHNVTSGSGEQLSVTCDGVDYAATGVISTTQPSFVSYVSGLGALNDMHLRSTDTVAKNGGVVGTFTTDRDGKARPVGSSWDIGAYEWFPQLPLGAGAILTKGSRLTE